MPMRGYALFIALWGALWTLYAFFTYTAFGALDAIFGPRPSPEFAADVAATRINLKVAIVLFPLSAVVAFGCAVGIFLGRLWAKRVWLVWCTFLMAVYFLALYVNPSKWTDHLELLVLAPLSWWVFRERTKRGEP
jgi:hypothetical protein